MKKYRTEFKLQVVQRFLAGKGGAKLLARRWSLPEEKIRTWVSHYRLMAGLTSSFPDPSYSQCSARSFKDCWRACAA